MSYYHTLPMSFQNILLLGEGDLTYSYSFCRGILHHNLIETNHDLKNCNIFISCFDSEDSILTKYPSTAPTAIKNLNALRSPPTTSSSSSSSSSKKNELFFVNINYKINATRPILEQLYTESSETTTIPLHFNHVIFNFPHLGKEDSLAHNCFLAHLLHEMKASLHKEDGKIYLSLAGIRSRYNI